MHQLTEIEQRVYDMICCAAENNLPCPSNMDIEDEADYSSTSMGPMLIARLERKGLIRVLRFQRFREVKILATGKWTARSSSQHGTNPHVPRGAKKNLPSDLKPYKRIR